METTPKYLTEIKNEIINHIQDKISYRVKDAIIAFALYEFDNDYTIDKQMTAIEVMDLIDLKGIIYKIYQVYEPKFDDIIEDLHILENDDKCKRIVSEYGFEEALDVYMYANGSIDPEYYVPRSKDFAKYILKNMSVDIELEVKQILYNSLIKDYIFINSIDKLVKNKMSDYF